jgi:deazaflavin-dependent oxidoreductase (nitroreductase family)
LREPGGCEALERAIGQPVLLLTVKGAKSGAPRETPLLYATDGENLVVVASKAGSASHPAWYHNVKANPTVDILAPSGRSGRYVGCEAEGEERARLWEEVNDLYSDYDVYQGRAGARRIPVMVFTPCSSQPALGHATDHPGVALAGGVGLGTWAISYAQPWLNTF